MPSWNLEFGIYLRAAHCQQVTGDCRLPPKPYFCRMHIAIVNNSVIPAVKYGGVERVIWWLGKELVRRNHKVTYIVNPGSHCDFADVQFLDKRPLHQQIPEGVDIVHYHGIGDFETKIPFISTAHGNFYEPGTRIHINTVGLSADHARRMNATAFVHNGLDFDEYGKPDFNNTRKFFHFLGDAAWKVKNLKGAIRIAKGAHEQLAVLGGNRINLSQGVKINFARNARFYGQVGGDVKNHLLNQSKGLIFPVLWPEPFGLAVIESLYFGCPVFATPFGSLPELVPPEVGVLSDSYSVLTEAVKNAGAFSPRRCHEFVVENFSASKMTDKYVSFYEKALNGETLNQAAPAITETLPKYLNMRP